MDISFKVLSLRQLLGFRHYGFFAPASHLPALMISYGAEAASAEAASGADYAELYFFKGRDAACLHIAWVRLILKWKPINVVQFLL